VSLVETALGPLFIQQRGKGRPLLLLAGLGGRGAFWASVAALLGEEGRLVIPDHPGCGASPPDGTAPSAAGLAARMVAALDALGLERVDLIGHSLGGAIAQEMALAAPERIGRLVLSATWAGPNPWFSRLFALRQSILDQLGPEAYLRHGETLGNPGWWQVENDAELHVTLSSRLAAFPGVALERARIAAVLAHDARGRLGAISAPTLVICAQDDQITPLPFSREIHRAIPGAALALLPTGGHFAPACTPGPYAASVRAFLDGESP
jgi:aminoacrylate hydrolase